jgi:hypothetical protein
MGESVALGVTTLWRHSVNDSGRRLATAGGEHLGDAGMGRVGGVVGPV